MDSRASVTSLEANLHFLATNKISVLNPLAVLRRKFDGPGGLRSSIAYMGTSRDSRESLALLELDLTIENINFGALFWRLQCSMV